MFLIAAHHYKIVMIGKLNFQKKNWPLTPMKRRQHLRCAQRVTLSRNRETELLEDSRCVSWESGDLAGGTQ